MSHLFVCSVLHSNVSMTSGVLGKLIYSKVTVMYKPLSSTLIVSVTTHTNTGTITAEDPTILFNCVCAKCLM